MKKITINWKSKTTKIVAICMATILVIGVGIGIYFATRTPRSEKLLIMNWGEYMDESILHEFETYYKEQTGKKVTVVYKTFLDSEEAEKAITKQKKDFDLICPSEYVIERLYNQGFLLPLDFEAYGISDEKENSYIGGLDEEIVTASAPNKGTDKNTYVIPYLYGTNGIMYDKEKIKTKGVTLFDEEGLPKKTADTYYGWDLLWKDNLTISMKSTGRDSFATAVLYNNREHLLTLEGEALKTELKRLFNNPDNAMLTAAQAAIQALSKDRNKEDDDSMKDEMMKGTGPDAGLFYSCDAGYTFEANENLWYYVPEEGSNFWVDGFVMPKYAVNKSAAHWFLNFICNPDIAYRNMDAAGACSPVEDAREAIRTAYEEDEDGEYFGYVEKYTGADFEAYKAMVIETMFPTKEATLWRCEKFHAFDNEELTNEVNELMSHYFLG